MELNLLYNNFLNNSNQTLCSKIVFKTGFCYFSNNKLSPGDVIYKYKNLLFKEEYFVPLILKNANIIPTLQNNLYNIDYDIKDINIDNIIESIFKKYNEIDKSVRDYTIYSDTNKIYYNKKNLKKIVHHFEYGDIINVFNLDGDDYIYILDEIDGFSQFNLCDKFNEHFYIEYKYVQTKGYMHYCNIMNDFDFRYLSLNASNNEFIDIFDSCIVPFYNKKKKEIGKISFTKNKILIFNEDKKWEKVKNKIIANFYGKDYCFSYYQKIFAENNIPFSILISTLEILDFKDFCIKKILVKELEVVKKSEIVNELHTEKVI